jgi:hypothetical protein
LETITTKKPRLVAGERVKRKRNLLQTCDQFEIFNDGSIFLVKETSWEFFDEF